MNQDSPISVLAVGLPKELGAKVTQRLGDVGIPVLLVDDVQTSAKFMRRTIDAIRAMEVVDLSPDPCEHPEDPSIRPVNDPWYNDHRGGKKRRW